MDNLISHLEQSLDEEECIKEALLLLSGLESSSNFCDQSSSSQSTSNTTPQQRTSPPDIKHTDQIVSKPKVVIDFQAKTLISLFVSQSSSLQKKNELPIKIVAFRINVPDFLLQDVCFCEYQSLWPSNFLDSCLKVLECFEKCKEERIVTQDSTTKAASLKTELTQLKLSGSAEAALAFIQENVAEYLNRRATPMRLGGRRSDQFMNTQEIPLQDRREQVTEQQQEQQEEVSQEQRGAGATVPTATATAEAEGTEAFQSSGSGSSGNSHSTGGGLHVPAAIAASVDESRGSSMNGSTTFSKLSALSGGSVSGSSSGSGGTATSATALNKAPITKKTYSSSCNNANNNSAAKSSPPALYKLAPLVEHQRCPKHFIIPLMEPDLMYNFQGTFAPSHRSITLGDMTRPMTTAAETSNKPKVNKAKVKKQRFSL